MPIPLRNGFDAAALRGLARKTKHGPQARRLLALAAVYERRQIVRDWVVRFNALGPDGLIDRKPPGVPTRLKDTHRSALVMVIEQGPILPFMAWCAGAWSIWSSGSGRNSGSPSQCRPEP